MVKVVKRNNLIFDLMLLAKRCFKILTHTSHIVHIDFFVKKLKTIPIKNMGQVMCYCGYMLIFFVFINSCWKISLNALNIYG